MNRFIVGFLAGALAMYWVGGHAPGLMRSMAGWLENTSRHYSGLPSGRPTDVHPVR
jgi:hypothetical protein